MPNMRNAKKKVRQIAGQKVENNEYKASMRTAIKNVEKAVNSNNKEEASSNLKIAIKRIDKATAKGAIKANTCARNKSRLTKKVNAMG